MSASDPIENAEEIIERFGGIRPMAKKLDVAVTTVQGWKKRNIIPAARREQVIEAAAEYDIDLSGLLADAPPVNDNGQGKVEKAVDKPEVVPTEISKETPDKTKEAMPEEVIAVSSSSMQENLEEEEVVQASKAEPKAEEPSVAEKPKVAPAAPSQSSYEADLNKRLEEAEKSAVSKSLMVSGVLVALGLGALIALVWPQAQDKGERLAALEQNVGQVREDVDAVKNKQSFFGAMIPENLGAQLDELKDKAGAAKVQIEQAAQVAGEKAKEISDDVMADESATIGERMEKLGVHVSALASSEELAAFVQKMQEMKNNLTGELQLEQAMSELNALMDVAKEESYVMDAVEGGEPAVEQDWTKQGQIFTTMLDQARGKSPALGQTFEGVPATDLKAAALLLGMSQFRSALNRDNEAFESDLNVLLGLVGEDNTGLREALLRLSPEAKTGVLTPSGLSNEFKGFAGDAVVASLSGEDANIQERARARMNDLFQVEKNGELVTGTETQAKLNRVQNMLDEGDLEGAISQAQALDGAAGEAISPWIGKAEATLMAQRAQVMLDKVMKGEMPAADDGARMLSDPESGLKILKPKPKMPSGGTGIGDANPYN